MAIVGDVTNDEALGIINIIRLVRRECGYSLLLADVSQMGTLHPETRKFAAAEMKRDGDYLSAICLVGASLITRSLVTLILRAVTLVGGNSNRLLTFPGSWQAGIEWTDRQRAEFQRRIAASRSSRPK